MRERLDVSIDLHLIELAHEAEVEDPDSDLALRWVLSHDIGGPWSITVESPGHYRYASRTDVSGERPASMAAILIVMDEARIDELARLARHAQRLLDCDSLELRPPTSHSQSEIREDTLRLGTACAPRNWTYRG